MVETKFYPSPGLRVLSSFFKNVLRVFEQRAFEESERTRFLERNDNRDVFLQKGEAGLAPLAFFDQVAVQRNLSQRIRFLLPLLCIGNLHRLPPSSRLQIAAFVAA